MPAPEKIVPSGFFEWVADSAIKSKTGLETLNNRRLVTPWITPTLLNSFVAPASPRHTVQYRYHSDIDRLEFRGYVNVAGAVSGNIAFNIIQPFWPEHDMSDLADVVDGAGFSVARYSIDSATGNVTIEWPAL